MTVLRRRALELRQDARHPLYLFSLSPADLAAVADISRVARGDARELVGYQRPEVREHVRDIAAYFAAGPALFPNSVILALSTAVTFTRSRGPRTDDGLAAAGTLAIPLPVAGRPRPAWVVDGQQRVLALSRCALADFAVPVSAFVADDVGVQRDQFLRVNNTRPLPRGLVDELLPEVSTRLPARLAARQLPAAVCEWLATAAESPFCGLIRRGATGRGAGDAGVFSDTPVVRMVGASLRSSAGCLFPYRNLATGETDADGICAVLAAYWAAVSRVFPDAWGLPSHRSRLTHSAGLLAVGRLMDRVMAGVDGRVPGASAHAERELRHVAPACRWTAGEWEELGGLAWDRLENTPRHVQALASFLIRTHLQANGGAR